MSKIAVQPNKDQVPFFSELKIEFDITDGDEITNRFCDRLEKELTRVKRRCVGDVLLITIKQCSKGGRWTRMCCAELGMGWVRLVIHWALKNSNGEVLASGSCHLEDSGNIGCSDIFDRSVPYTLTL